MNQQQNSSNPQRFGLIVIGDEILSGKRIDKHMPKVIELLAARGLQLAWAEYVGDEPVRITAALGRAGLVHAYGHCSARIDATSFLVAPSRPLGLVRPGERCTVVPLDGDLPEGVLPEVRIHREIYRRRPDVGGVAAVGADDPHRLPVAADRSADLAHSRILRPGIGVDLGQDPDLGLERHRRERVGIGIELPVGALRRLGQAAATAGPATASAPRPAPIGTAPSEWRGDWSGTLHTYEGPVPARLRVLEDGRALFRLGDQLWSLLDKVEVEDGRLRGYTLSQVPTADARRRRHALRVDLRLRGDALAGEAMAWSGPKGPAGGLDPYFVFALNHWLELRRADSGDEG